MEREEVLRRSREENRRVDERFLLMEWHAAALALMAFTVACALLFLWDFFHGVDTGSLRALMFIVVAAISFCRFAQRRSRLSLVAGVLMAAAAVAVIADHVVSTW